MTKLEMIRTLDVINTLDVILTALTQARDAAHEVYGSTCYHSPEYTDAARRVQDLETAVSVLHALRDTLEAQ